MRILFLDVDGVLNGHDWHEGARSNTLRRPCIDQLSRILKETDCRVVLSSAWRYMVHCKALTCTGFEYLLRTHGAVGIVGKIVGVTCRDEDCCHCGHRHTKRRRPGVDDRGRFVCVRCGRASTRGDQIGAWRYSQALAPAGVDWTPPRQYVVLDDQDLGITAAGHPLVLTDGACGLTGADADRAIATLLGRRYRGRRPVRGRAV